MKTLYEKGLFDIVPKGLIPFTIQTKKGMCHGVYCEEQPKIFVHGVYGNKCLKGLMNILINKFKTNKITFTPLITESVPMKVKEGIICAFAGNLVVLGLLIIFPQITDFMLSIPIFISIPLGIILLITASIIFQWSVSKPQTQCQNQK